MPRTPMVVRTAFACLSLVLSVSCGRRYDAVLQEAARQFGKGRAEAAISLLEKGLIDAAAVKSFNKPFPESINRVLLVRDRKEVAVVHPVVFTVEDAMPIDAIAYCPASGRTVLVRAGRIAVYTGRGKRIAESALPRSGEKTPKAATWHGNDVIVYDGGALHRFDPDSRTFRLLLDRKPIDPPFPGYHQVHLGTHNGLLTIATGIAGRYRIRVVDIGNGEDLIRPAEASSYKNLISDRTLYYITGGAGGWRLVSLGIKGGATATVYSLTSLLEIELFPEGVLYETREGLCLGGYTPRAVARLPFRYRLYGRCSGDALIEHGKTLHVVRVDRFIRLVRMTEQRLPGLFRPPPDRGL